jgi:ParB/RepB/Spo0J family partition protein
METIEILTDYILPNPWQPRESDPLTGAGNAEHIKKIALSIAQDGLMQVPVGRWVFPDGKVVHGMGTADLTGNGIRIQLAFGHSRLAAYKWLEELKDHSNLVGDWTRMPVAIRELTDEEMFRLAVGENLARKDLTPIEEARAMLRYREDFGKTSAEIGALFNLAESSVRNKMRLMGLPADIQAALASGQISEGAARELLRFYDLPEETQAKGGDNYRTRNEYYQDGKSILKRALSGITAEAVRDMINHLITSAGNNLHEAAWKWDEAFDLALDPALRAETCKICEVKLTLEGKTYCPAYTCYQAKNELWTKRRLAAASLACGIRAPDNFHDCGKIFVAEEVRSSGCQNLRVMYAPHAKEFRDERNSLVPGFNDVVIVCGNRNSICTCANGLVARQVAEEKRLRFEETKAAVAQIEARPAASPKEAQAATNDGVISADELRQAARDEKKAQQRERDELARMRVEFARKVREAAMNWNKFVWYMLLNKSTYNLMHHAVQIGTIEQSLTGAALEMAERETAYYNRIDLDSRRKQLNDLLAALGLSPLADGTLLGYVEADGTETVYAELPEL